MSTMKLTGLIATTALMALSASAYAGSSYDSRTLVLKNVTGTVHVRTANVQKISVDIDKGADIIDAPKVSLKGGEVVVRGKKIRNMNCSSKLHRYVNDGSDTAALVAKMNAHVRMSKSAFPGFKKHPLADYPTLTIAVPVGTSVTISGGRVFGDVGDVANADVQINGCGAFMIGRVSDALDVQLNGSGDVFAGPVGGILDAQLNGSGDLNVADVAAKADAQVNGSGDLRIDAVGGIADAQVNGSGDVYLGATRGLDAQVNGSGDIHVVRVEGPLDASINGSGDIKIAGGTATPFSASIIGSGDVAFQGHANGVSARVVGSGDITLASYEGEFHASKHGVHVLNN